MKGGGCLCCWSRKSCPGHRLASDKTIRFSHNLGKIIPTPNTPIPTLDTRQTSIIGKQAKRKRKKRKTRKKKEKEMEKERKKKRQKEKKKCIQYNTLFQDLAMLES